MIANQTTTKTETSTPNPNDGRFLNPQAGEYVHRAQWKATVLGTLNVLFIVLAIRLTLVIAIIGAFVLARAALVAEPSIQQPALVLVAVYCVTVVMPMVWLASRR